jgi:hypothetical protein
MKFEAVHEVDEYYDGPRGGVTSFNGSLYRFRSRYLDAIEYKGDFESVDIFELTPVEGPSTQAILATAQFRVVPGQPVAEPGHVRKFEVAWQIVSDQA